MNRSLPITLVGLVAFHQNLFADDLKPVALPVLVEGRRTLQIAENDPKQSTKDSSAEQDAAIAKIEAIGGNVRRDRNQPGQPVVSVDLTGNQYLTDDDMKSVGSLTTLKELHLHSTRISDDGLKHLAGLTRLT